MLVLFAVGVMSIFWMLLIAAGLFAEKVLPGGERLSVVLAVALVGLGVWVAVAPGSVPGLTDPGAARMSAALP
jgi:predicted metal-binding membrane protein